MIKNFCDICGKDMSIEGDLFYHCEPNQQIYAGTRPYFKEYDICNECWHKMMRAPFIPHDDHNCCEDK